MSDINAYHPEFIGFWLRFLAFLIDSLAVSVLLIGLVGIFFGFEGVAVSTGQTQMLDGSTGLQALLSAVIFIALWVWLASTPGKLVFDSYIVDANTFRRAQPWQLVVRYLGYYVNIFTLGLGFLWIAFDKRKQGLHDKLAGTVVIRGKPLDQRDEPPVGL